MPSARTAQDGDSLIEVLVALAVLSIGITALLGALADHATTTTINRDQSQIETALMSGAEYVKSLPFSTGAAPTPCSLTGWTTIATSKVPYDDSKFVLEYGNGSALGSISCTEIAQLQVRATGQGFQNVLVTVLKRP